MVVWAELCEFYARVFHVRQPPVPSSDSQVREDLDVTATMGVRELATATVPSSEAQEVRGSYQSMPEGYTTHSPSQSLSVSHAPIDTQSFLYSAGDQHTYESRYASDWFGPSGHPAHSHQVRSPFLVQDRGTKQVDRPTGHSSFAVAPPQGGADKPSGAALPLLGRRHRSDCGPVSYREIPCVEQKSVAARSRSRSPVAGPPLPRRSVICSPNHVDTNPVYSQNDLLDQFQDFDDAETEEVYQQPPASVEPVARVLSREQQQAYAFIAETLPESECTLLRSETHDISSDFLTSISSTNRFYGFPVAPAVSRIKSVFNKTRQSFATLRTQLEISKLTDKVKVPNTYPFRTEFGPCPEQLTRPEMQLPWADYTQLATHADKLSFFSSFVAVASRTIATLTLHPPDTWEEAEEQRGAFNNIAAVLNAYSESGIASAAAISARLSHSRRVATLSQSKLRSLPLLNTPLGSTELCGPDADIPIAEARKEQKKDKVILVQAPAPRQQDPRQGRPYDQRRPPQQSQQPFRGRGDQPRRSGSGRSGPYGQPSGTYDRSSSGRGQQRGRGRGKGSGPGRAPASDFQ